MNSSPYSWRSFQLVIALSASLFGGIRAHASRSTCHLTLPCNLFANSNSVTATLAARAADSLADQLNREDFAELAQSAREHGDPVRGAYIFFQPMLACSKCHGTGERTRTIGPDLTEPIRDVADSYWVESILRPSIRIKPGYETIVVRTQSGTVHSGIIAKDGDGSLVLHDIATPDRQIAIPKDQILERKNSDQSIMPDGQVNFLGGRQEFLDLIRYLMEIGEKGAARARQLRPPDSFFAAPQLPEYEKHIDHASIIQAFDQSSLERGAAIYNRVCINCHGTSSKPGSMPTSLAFATGRFKNGADPYRMYQTLTHGFGLMTAQTWMVPQQKYDVIQYIREEFLRPFNPSQYAVIDQELLDALPRGDTRGPEPSNIELWSAMDYGPNLIATYEIGEDGSNFAYKGIAMQLDGTPGGIARGHHWMVFDHDTMRVAATWSGQGFIDWNGINFNGKHAVHPRVVGTVSIANRTGPGWANPADGSFDDPRLRGRDGRPYGPLPRDWTRYKGIYHFGQQVILSYTVGDTAVLESPGLAENSADPIFTRTFNIAARSRDMVLQVAQLPPPTTRVRRFSSTRNRTTSVVRHGYEPGIGVIAGLSPIPDGFRWSRDDNGRLLLSIPAGAEPLRLVLAFGREGDAGRIERFKSVVANFRAPVDLRLLTTGGPRRWPNILETTARLGTSDGPFAIDALQHPINNPWQCQLRFTGFDFFPEAGRAAICTWDGDVWIVDGFGATVGSDAPVDQSLPLRWQRIASGLFQPLGLKIVDGRIFVTCRDQIVVLHDLNGDGETDFYENFNNDHQVTEHFHEFAMGLQTDRDGNFYYAKSARHALPAIVPQHGTLLRVSNDGSRTDILATGFRAANGVCVNPDGSFVVTDQEGHWNPKNRINWVRPGGFYGNMFGYHDVTDTSDSAMEQPLCWITNSFDRSPAELLWVPDDTWGPLRGSLLNLSYGYGKVYVVPFETVDNQKQGGMCALPIPSFPTGIIRGRFQNSDGQLYLCGMYAWAGNQTEPGGFYRLRFTGKPPQLPIGLSARRSGIDITFTDPLEPAAASNVENFAVKSWSLKRTANYGSDHYDEQSLNVTGASLSDDRRTVHLEIPSIQPTWCMEIRYELTAADGEPVNGTIHNTIHHLR